MKERPIIFSGPMVRAILNGHKTQTRRVMKPQVPVPGSLGHGDFLFVDEFGEETVKQSPYGVPGDCLWVREPWGVGRWGDNIKPSDLNRQAQGTFQVFYRATDSKAAAVRKWRPSMYMPRKYCRLFLNVKVIWVEQLQEIKPFELQLEGFAPPGPPLNPIEDAELRPRFAEFWDSLNVKRGYTWDSNPWVWVIEFERTEKS